MSDPVDEFEKKLKKTSLSELQAYKKLLDERIKEKISDCVSNEKIAPLIFHRGILEQEIKSRNVLNEEAVNEKEEIQNFNENSTWKTESFTFDKSQQNSNQNYIRPLAPEILLQ